MQDAVKNQAETEENHEAWRVVDGNKPTPSQPIDARRGRLSLNLCTLSPGYAFAVKVLPARNSIEYA